MAIWALSLLAAELSSRGLSPGVVVDGIQSLVEVGNLVGPLAHPVLYLRRKITEAIPKYVSARTSYNPV
jgi:hypothetical protein